MTTFEPLVLAVPGVMMTRSSMDYAAVVVYFITDEAACRASCRSNYRLMQFLDGAADYWGEISGSGIEGYLFVKAYR